MDPQNTAAFEKLTQRIDALCESEKSWKRRATMALVVAWVAMASATALAVVAYAHGWFSLRFREVHVGTLVVDGPNGRARGAFSGLNDGAQLVLSGDDSSDSSVVTLSTNSTKAELFVRGGGTNNSPFISLRADGRTGARTAHMNLNATSPDHGWTTPGGHASIGVDESGPSWMLSKELADVSASVRADVNTAGSHLGLTSGSPNAGRIELETFKDRAEMRAESGRNSTLMDASDSAATWRASHRMASGNFYEVNALANEERSSIATRNDARGYVTMDAVHSGSSIGVGSDAGQHWSWPTPATAPVP